MSWNQSFRLFKRRPNVDKQLERELEIIEDEYNSGSISLHERNRAIIELEREAGEYEREMDHREHWDREYGGRT